MWTKRTEVVQEERAYGEPDEHARRKGEGTTVQCTALTQQAALEADSDRNRRRRVA